MKSIQMKGHALFPEELSVCGWVGGWGCGGVWVGGGVGVGVCCLNIDILFISQIKDA